MAILPILIVPDPALRQRAKPVEEVTDDIRATLKDMLETMYDAPGIGLAATQVGIMKRMFVMDLEVTEDGQPGNPIQLINPEVIESSEQTATQQEGCLSMPGQFADVTRPKWVKVAYTDENGDQQEVEGKGLLAACLQHEIDHLDGKLFIDYLSLMRRRILLKKLQKQQKALEG